MDRREFIRNTALTGAALSSFPYILKGKQLFEMKPMESLGFAEDDSIMIVIELFGGNDGLNTIVPAGQSEYYKLRPNISLKVEDLVRYESSDLFMHPALVTDLYNNGMMGLLENGNLAIVERVGYENYTMSHFRSADIWHSGIINTDPSVKLTEGWLGRFFAEKLPEYPFVVPEHPIAIKMGGQIPLALRSNKGPMGIALTDPERFYQRGKGLTPYEGLLTGDSFYDREFNFINLVAKQSEIYSTAVKSAYDSGTNAVEYPQRGLEQVFASIARLISGGLKTRVFYLGLSSFDSHVQQMNDPMSGQHPYLLRQLANGISLFMLDATIQGFADRVAGLTTSEFGRRAYDNGSRGSDHGAACVQFMFAHDNNIDSGRKGDPPLLTDLDDYGNVRYFFDFRQLYADFLETWFGGTKADNEKVFGEYVDPIGVLKPRATSVEEDLNTVAYNGLEVFPNPSRGPVNIRFDLKNASDIHLSIVSTDGHYRETMTKGHSSPGIYDFNLRLDKTGSYVVNLRTSRKSYSQKIVVMK